MAPNRIKVRIYYEDTDFGGVVYYANYLRYMERGRSELFRQNNISLAEYKQKGFLFAVADVHVKYMASATYDDLLDVDTSLTKTGPASFVFGTKIYNQDGKLLVSAETKVACINRTGRPCKIPDEIIEKINVEDDQGS
ncbi:MAG: YbgC/FadM family acyl-CoA thioesterase [Desulfobacterales bacterium]|nr:YbgC/FadM family acyl-CoA thioesterase [Desulfobacterales bacterium]